MPSIAAILPIAPSPGNKRPGRLARLVLSLLGLLLSSASYCSPGLVLKEQGEARSLAAYSDLYVDPQQRHHIGDIRSAELARQFRPAESGDLNIVPKDGDKWFRFTLYNPSATPLLHVLEVQPSSLTQVALYRGAQQVNPVTAAEVGHIRKHWLFTLYTPAQDTATYHLKISSAQAQTLSLKVYDYASLLAHISQQEFLNALLMGMLVALALFNAGRYALSRHRLNGIVALHCLLIMLWQGFTWGYLGEPQGLLPPWIQYRMAMLGLTMAAVEVLFAQWFPVYAQDKPGPWPAVFRGLLVANALAMVLISITDNRFTAQVINTMLPLTTVALTAAALSAYLVSYGRLQLVYLLTHLMVTLVYILLLFVHFAGMGSAIGLEYSMIVTSGIVVLIHTLLVMARQRLRKRLQAEESQRIAVLGEVSRVKTDIVARITHDIRTPMSAMLGASELLQETQLSGSQQEYLRTLQRSSQELLQLLEETGQSARFNERDVELSKQLMNLPELVAETLAGFRNIAAEHSLELICDVDPSVPEALLGDPSRIKQLLSHAMNSAFEHSEAGHILLRVAAAHRQSGQIDFDLTHLGRPFTQQEKNALHRNAPSEDSRINPRFAIIGQLVALMGGKIFARSSGHGINGLHFSLRLGLPSQAYPLAANKPAELQGKRLLLVDNNRTFCDVISKQCEHWGLEVFASQSEQSALAVVRNQQLLARPLNIILVDYSLPSGSGLNLAQRIVEEYRDGPAPLVMLIAHSNIKLERETLDNAGIRRVLHKPLTGVALRSALVAEINFDSSLVSKAEQKQTGELHCLVAEDNPTNAQVLTRMLGKLGVNVTLVDNGQQAVNSFMRQEFDLVFMDIEMPIMDGVEATQQIRAFERDNRPDRTPIFGLTANALDEQRDTYLKAGMDLHLIKPIRLWELTETIKRWTDFQPAEQ